MHGVLEQAGAKPACISVVLRGAFDAARKHAPPQELDYLKMALPRGATLRRRIACLQEAARADKTSLSLDRALFYAVESDQEWFQRLSLVAYLEQEAKSTRADGLREELRAVVATTLGPLRKPAAQQLIVRTTGEIVEAARVGLRTTFSPGKRLLPWLYRIADQISVGALLSSAAVEGDKEAVWGLFEPHRGWMLGKACALLGRTDGEDVLHETYVQVLQSAPRFRGDCDLKTWLYRILVRSAHQWRNARQTRERRSIALEDADIEALVSPGSDVDPFLRALKQEFLDRVLEQKGGRHHRVAVLWSKGYTIREIAAITGQALGTTQNYWQEAKDVYRLAQPPLEGEAE